MSQFNPAAIQAMNAIEQRRRKQQRQQGALPSADPMANEAANLGASPRPRAAAPAARRTSGPVDQPFYPTSPQPAPAAAQPAQRRATNPMMGPPDQYASRVQAGAQEFRTRRAQQDAALTARGIDPAAAREEQFINRAPDTRAMVLRAATLRARGQSAAADRMIEEVRQINQSNRVEGLERQALRNPERAGSAPAIDRIARRQQQQNAMRETEDALFTDANAIARVGSNTALTQAMQGRVDAETGFRSAIETQEGRIGLASDQVGAERSNLQMQQATNESRMRILEATTEMTSEQIGRDLEIIRQTAPAEIQQQLTAAETRLAQAQTGLEREIAMRSIQTIVNQVGMETAEPRARAEAGAAVAAFDAQTAAAELSTLEAGEQARRIAELGPAERQAVQAQLQAQTAASQRSALSDIRGAETDASGTSVDRLQTDTANDLSSLQINRTRRYIDAGFDASDENEVNMANILAFGMGKQMIDRATESINSRRGLRSTDVAQMEQVLNAAKWLQASAVDPEKKAKIASGLLASLPKKTPAFPANTRSLLSLGGYARTLGEIKDTLEQMAN